MCTTANNREIIEPRIIQLVRELTAAPATDEVADALKPVMEQVVDQASSSSQGGKRLRALLALDAFDILAGDVTPDRRDAMIDLACAIEVFQTAALVHDDIIDESDLRRGKPSAHHALEQAVHSGAIGRGLGLMLGDILATACIEITRRSASRLPNTDALNEAFLTMQREVEIGQVLDLAVEMTPLSNPEALANASLNVFRWKTASYTTIAPLLLALLAAGESPDQARHCALAVAGRSDWRSNWRMTCWMSSDQAAIPENQLAETSEKASAQCCWLMLCLRQIRRIRPIWLPSSKRIVAMTTRWPAPLNCSRRPVLLIDPASASLPYGVSPVRRLPVLS